MDILSLRILQFLRGRWCVAAQSGAAERFRSDSRQQFTSLQHSTACPFRQHKANESVVTITLNKTRFQLQRLLTKIQFYFIPLFRIHTIALDFLVKKYVLSHSFLYIFIVVRHGLASLSWHRQFSPEQKSNFVSKDQNISPRRLENGVIYQNSTMRVRLRGWEVAPLTRREDYASTTLITAPYLMSHSHEPATSNEPAY